MTILRVCQNDIKDLKNDLKDLKNDMNALQKEMHEFKDEIGQDMQEFKKEIKGEIENLVSKKEFYSEMKNLSLNLTIKMGVIMGAGIAIIGVITKI